MAEIENFSLDAQFADGGCATVDLARYNYWKGTANILVGALNDNDVNAVAGLMEAVGLNKFFTVADIQSIVADEEENAEDELAGQFVLAEQNIRVTDNKNSGSCYYTYSNASGKSFS